MKKETPSSLSTSDLVRLLRRTEKYELWRRAVFIRDRFTCQHCGARNGRRRVIEADHVKSLATVLREHSIATLEQAMRCAAVWDVTNGRTLCRTCHEKTDSYPENFKGKQRHNFTKKPR